ncbi:MAG: GIY-YIG nuclease family protein [Selenomonadaceae bacterium]|nr:GIY-YIG nuclease family protein [Selenomonadaceae bacterium]
MWCVVGDRLQYCGNVWLDRYFQVKEIRRDCMGREKPWGKLLRYELVEHWSPLELRCQTPNARGLYYPSRGKSEHIRAFNTEEEAYSFLNLLAQVLNTQSEAPPNRVIAPELTEIISYAKTEELQAIQMKEKTALNKLRLIIDCGCFPRVYAFALKNYCNYCKIGISGNLRQRITNINSKYPVVKFCCTDEFEDSEARYIESECHRFFHAQKSLLENENEYFYISYDEVKAKLQTYSDVYESPFNQ